MQARKNFIATLDRQFGQDANLIIYIGEKLEKSAEFQKIIDDPHFSAFFELANQRYQGGALDLYLYGLLHLTIQFDPSLLTHENYLRIMLLILLTKEANEAAKKANLPLIQSDFQENHFSLKKDGQLVDVQEKLLNDKQNGAFDVQWQKIRSRLPGLPANFPSDDQVVALLNQRFAAELPSFKKASVNKPQIQPVDANGSSTSSIQKNLPPVVPVNKPAAMPVVQNTPAPKPAATQPKSIKIFDIQSISVPEHVENGETLPASNCLKIIRSMQGQVTEMTINLGKRIMPNSYVVDKNTNTVFLAGLDKAIHVLDLNKPSPDLIKTDMIHESYVASVGLQKSGNQSHLISSSKDKVYFWDKAEPEPTQIRIPESKVITSVVGLDDGWTACADRIGRVYFIDPNKNIFEYDDGSPKFSGEQRLSKLTFKDGLFTQSDRHGNQSKQFTLKTIQLKPFQPVSESAFREREEATQVKPPRPGY